MSCGRLHVLCEYCFFWLCAAAGRVLVPQEGIEPMPPAVEARIRNHWNTMEFPECRILIFFPWCQITSWSFFFCFLAKDHGVWNLSFPTTDDTKGPVSERTES